MNHVIGALMIAAMFVAFAAVLWHAMGWRAMLGIYGGTAVIVLWIFGAATLLTS